LIEGASGELGAQAAARLSHLSVEKILKEKFGFPSLALGIAKKRQGYSLG